MESVADLPPSQLLQAATVANIEQSVAALKSETLLASDVADGSITVVGAEYRLHSGKVDFLT